MSNFKWVVLILAIVVVGGGAIYLINNGKLGPTVVTVTGTPSAPAASAVNNGPSDYQAVFLINNQVYFGKLSDRNSQFPTLTDVYYLQVNQPIQPAQGKAPATQPDISLVKLGGELHGPTDEMKLNRDQILLIEDLRADSNVVRAIKAYKDNLAKPAATKTQTP